MTRVVVKRNPLFPKQVKNSYLGDYCVRVEGLWIYGHKKGHQADLNSYNKFTDKSYFMIQTDLL